MNEEQLKQLTNMELMVFAAEAKASGDDKLVDSITDELQRRKEGVEETLDKHNPTYINA